MKATLEFTLPEENYRFSNAMNGEKAVRTLQEVAEELRRIVKYEDQATNLLDKVDEIRKSIYESFPNIDEM